MKPKFSAALLIIIVLLGVSANTAAYAQIISPQQPATTDIVKPVQALNSNSNSNLSNNIQSASIDLNNPIGLEQNLQSNLLVNCPTGVVVYQTSLITNEIVPVCVTSDMLNSQLFKIDVDVKDNDDNDNDNDNDGNDHHKKYIKYHPIHFKNYWNHYWSNTHPGKNYNNDNVVLTDPRNDPKYDSIDWQDDDPKKNLSIEQMDKILEERQNENKDTGDQSGQITATTTIPLLETATASEQDANNIASNDGGSDGGEGNTGDDGSSGGEESSESSESGSDSDSGDSGDDGGSSDGGDSGDSGDSGSEEND
jgi:hypothetical protein